MELRTLNQVPSQSPFIIHLLLQMLVYIIILICNIIVIITTRLLLISYLLPKNEY